MDAKSLSRIGCLCTVALLAVASPAQETREGVAVAIVYDTSGSMQEKVADTAGQMTQKYVIGKRALNAVIDRLDKASKDTQTPLRIHAGLVVFSGRDAREVVGFGPLDSQRLRDWVAKSGEPKDSTPLGTAVKLAGEAVVKSRLSRKHVLVITDGVNTTGSEPAATIPQVKLNASQNNTVVQFHFIAFDVDSKVFAGVKKLGANVLGAANEQELNAQLNYIIEEKILLEKEETPPPPAKENK